MDWVPYWSILAATLVEFSFVFFIDERVTPWLLSVDGAGSRQSELRRQVSRTLERFAAYVVSFVPLFAWRGAVMAVAATVFIAIGRGLAWRVAVPAGQEWDGQPVRGWFSVVATTVLVMSVYIGAWGAWRLSAPEPLPWVESVWRVVVGELSYVFPGLVARGLSLRSVLAFAVVYAFMLDGATLIVRSILSSLDLVGTQAGPPWPPAIGAGAILQTQVQAQAHTDAQTAAASADGPAAATGSAGDAATAWGYIASAVAARTLDAGKVIGSLERVLILTLVMYGQYQVIGLVVAAKSIFRFEAASRGQAEYFLIGTLSSLFLAVLGGLLLQQAVLPLAR